MQGEFDEARDYLERAERRLLELGQTLQVAASHHWALVEDLAGNPKGVEGRIRKGIEALRAAGETGFLSTSAVWLADALTDQGRYDEALEATRLSEEASAVDDIASQAGWRSARARVYARQGRLEDAERLAREAVAIMDRTDHLVQVGGSKVIFSEVLLAAGKRDEAEAMARRALDAFERKGAVVSADRTRRFLEELAAEG